MPSLMTASAVNVSERLAPGDFVTSPRPLYCVKLTDRPGSFALALLLQRWADRATGGKVVALLVGNPLPPTLASLRTSLETAGVTLVVSELQEESREEKGGKVNASYLLHSKLFQMCREQGSRCGPGGFEGALCIAGIFALYSLFILCVFVCVNCRELFEAQCLNDQVDTLLYRSVIVFQRVPPFAPRALPSVLDVSGTD